MAERPHRLERIFEQYDPPLYFVTFNTARRRRVLANNDVFECFRDFATKGRDRDIAVGRYVLMPDHVHLFVCGPREFDLSQWIRILKRVLSRVLVVEHPHWQEGFFDHLIRNSEEL
jgi:REP element-mobilizing transposase RayT